MKLSGLPLFPLQTVLFPDADLSLRIFEPRYLTMIRRCHQVGAPFGVVRLTRGREVSAAGIEESFEAVGTLAVVAELQAIQPALLQVQCKAQQRFRITSHSRHAMGLWLADVERIDADLPTRVPEELQHVAAGLQKLGSGLAERGLPPLAQPERFDDCGYVSNRWAEMLPMQPELKQRLMVLDSPLLRLELVSDTLERLKILENL